MKIGAILTFFISFSLSNIQGAIVNAAIQVCGRDEWKDKVAVCIIPSFGERYFTHPMFDHIKAKAEGLKKQPLPEPYDNRDFGFETERG
jgi:hypothetical protein